MANLRGLTQPSTPVIMTGLRKNNSATMGINATWSRVTIIRTRCCCHIVRKSVMRVFLSKTTYSPNDPCRQRRTTMYKSNPNGPTMNTQMRQSEVNQAGMPSCWLSLYTQRPVQRSKAKK